MTTWRQRFVEAARRLRADALTLWIACRRPDAPLAAKLLGLLVVVYAFSPIDLIPDVIPVLGLLDEMVLLPGLIWLALRQLPPALLNDCRRDAAQRLAEAKDKPLLPKAVRWTGAAIIVALWLLLAWLAWPWLTSAFAR